jgi:hypothetical protein
MSVKYHLDIKIGFMVSLDQLARFRRLRDLAGWPGICCRARQAEDPWSMPRSRGWRSEAGRAGGTKGSLRRCSPRRCAVFWVGPAGLPRVTDPNKFVPE